MITRRMVHTRLLAAFAAPALPPRYHRREPRRLRLRDLDALWLNRLTGNPFDIRLRPDHSLVGDHRFGRQQFRRGEMTAPINPIDRALALPIWSGTPTAVPLGGGITNLNVLVTDANRRAVVRIGDDIPVHQIMRFNELAASRAAHAAGVSPAVLYHEPGALVIDFVEGRTMTAEDLRQEDNLTQALALVMHTHRDIPRHLRGPALTFWVFQVLRDYAATLTEGRSRHLVTVPALMDEAAQLEAAVGRVELVFGHNDLLPANFLHDGNRMWLIDWDYAGWGSPLFDLGGLAANTGLDPVQEDGLLAAYYGQAPDGDLRRRYRAMKAAAALREAMWSMVQEIHSGLDFDYAAYTADYLATYRAALAVFRTSS